ncbi:MAG TPA: response regulator, partial [Bacteroidales bacterium]|nr:response regulator [Bacteroidales bacterium]
FFTNISHEIRTPLTLILGPMEDMKKSRALPSELKNSFDIMQRNGHRMLRLVNQLLDFRKIQNKKMRLRITEMDYSQFVRKLCENFSYFARQKKIKFETDLPETPYYMWIDAEKVDSIFFNILSNAFKFTSPGRKVTVSWDEGDTFVDVVISDQGKGIARERLPLIFERYISHSDESDYFTGTGIGLALSNELVKMHSGTILVESRPGEGSMFRVRLRKGNEHFEPEDFVSAGSGPMAHDFVSLEPQKIVNMPADPVANSRMPVIMLVEDNLEIIEYLKNALGGDYVIRYAVDGIQGLKTIRETQPDLVITDIMMPGMNGVEMTGRMKEDFEVSHIPVIMLTAKSNMEDQIGGIESGAEAYVLKPFNSEYLRAVISNILKQRTLILRKMSHLKEFSPGKVKITNRDEEFLNSILNAIEEQYNDPGFNVERLSQVSNLSRTVFYHKIKSLTGMSPVDFLKQMRLKIVARILLETNNTISETAYACGFNDEKYFRKCFRDLFGMTPGEYRKGKEPEKI